MIVLEITVICLSKKISVNITGYLKGLIKEDLQLYKEVTYFFFHLIFISV